MSKTRDSFNFLIVIWIICYIILNIVLWNTSGSSSLIRNNSTAISPSKNKYTYSYEESDLPKIYKRHPCMYWLTPKLYSKVLKYSIKHQVPTELVLGLIYAESRGNPNATGKSVKTHIGAVQARGLVQVMPFHWKRGRANELYNQDINLDVGISYLSKCIYWANGNFSTALKNYNSGPASTYYNKPYIKEILRIYSDLITIKKKILI